MSSAEFVEWQAFQRLEGPFAPEREDWRATIIASTIAEVNRDRKHRSKPYRPDDFIPDWPAQSGVEKEQPHPEEVATKVKRYFQGLAHKARGRRQ
jgi:hypothetical protein